MSLVLATVSLDVGDVDVALSLGVASDGVVLNVERHDEEREQPLRVGQGQESGAGAGGSGWKRWVGGERKKVGEGRFNKGGDEERARTRRARDGGKR